jgi:hypothetical protein
MSWVEGVDGKGETETGHDRREGEVRQSTAKIEGKIPDGQIECQMAE